MVEGFKTETEMEEFKKNKLKAAYYEKKRQRSKHMKIVKKSIADSRFRRNEDKLYTTEKFLF